MEERRQGRSQESGDALAGRPPPGYASICSGPHPRQPLHHLLSSTPSPSPSPTCESAQASPTWGCGSDAQGGKFCSFPAHGPRPRGHTELAKPLGHSTEPKRSGQSPDVEGAHGQRGRSWPRPTLLPAAEAAHRSLPRSVAWGAGSLTFGSTRRGVLRLMKDFMTLLREAEVGVMSIWFLCTVCRKVLRGRTTCRRGPGSGLGQAGGTEGRQTPTHLAGWTGRGRGLAPGGL